MFRNDRGKRFQDVTTGGGFGQLQKGHAVSFADFDRDGDEDVFEVLGGAFPGDRYFSALLENPGHSNHWIGLRLEGQKSNRAAMGARVRVVVKDADGSLRTIHRVVNSGTSFGDAPFEIHAGLGASGKVMSIAVDWPAGGHQQFGAVARDGIYKLREGVDTPKLIRVQPFRFAKEAHNHNK